MGDFNTDLLSQHSPRARKFLHITESASFHILPLQPTHHSHQGEDSWLDLILTSDPVHVSSHGQYPAPGFSCHDLVYLSYILKPPKSRPKVLHLRNISRVDFDILRKDAENIDWEPLWAASTVDDKVKIFNDAIVKLYDKHAPTKQVNIHRLLG